MSTALSPPPRMPSPQYMPSPLPSPRPALPRRTSRNRLHLPAHPEDPPIPPRLIGSPLLKKMTVRPDEPHLLSYKAQSELWIDGDEFGTRRTESTQTPPASPSSPKRAHRRTPSIVVSPPARTRSRSPPPSPMPAAPPPPVPPIPSFALATPGVKRATLRSPPSSYSQIRIPDIDHSSPLAPASQPKRTRPGSVAS